MAAAFGFSAGDLIMGVNLIRNIIKALNDSKGSSKEYLELICELRGLEVVLIQVESQYSLITDLGQQSALRQSVEECVTIVEKFLRSLGKYHGHLSLFGSNNKLKDSVRKMQWHLCKADELNSFRLCITLHVQRIQLMLTTIQV